MRVKKPNRDLNLQAEEIKNKIWNRDKIGSLKSLIFVWCNKNIKKKKKPSPGFICEEGGRWEGFYYK